MTMGCVPSVVDDRRFVLHACTWNNIFTICNLGVCSMDMQTAAIAVKMLKLICSTQNPPTLRSVRVKAIYKFLVPVGMARMK